MDGKSRALPRGPDYLNVQIGQSVIVRDKRYTIYAFVSDPCSGQLWVKMRPRSGGGYQEPTE